MWSSVAAAFAPALDLFLVFVTVAVAALAPSAVAALALAFGIASCMLILQGCGALQGCPEQAAICNMT